jgi:hypothetical protein
MIVLQLDDKKITVDPQLKVWQYQKFNKNGMGESMVELLAVFLDMPVKKLKNLPKEQVDLVTSYITNSMEQANPNEFVQTFVHDGIEYGFENRWEKLAWGAWQDLEVLGSGENITENIHSLLAVLYRPVIGKDKKGYIIEPYDSETIMTRAELFKELPVNYWFGCANFFLLIGRQYISGIKNSLELTNKWNNLMMKGWKTLPKFLQKRLPLDTILISHIKLAGRTSQSSSR